MVKCFSCGSEVDMTKPFTRTTKGKILHDKCYQKIKEDLGDRSLI